MRFKIWFEDTAKNLGSTNASFVGHKWDHGWAPDNTLILQFLRFLQGPGKGSESIYAFTEPMREAIVVAAFEMVFKGMPKNMQVIDHGGNITPAVKQHMQRMLGVRGIDFLVNQYRFPIVNAWEKLSGQHFFSPTQSDQVA